MIYEDSDIDKDGAHGSMLFLGALIFAVVVALFVLVWRLMQGI